MLILTNGLTDSADEGFLNVANNLVKRLKKADDGTKVISYERKSELTDCFLELNKLLLSFRLFLLLRKNKSGFLYIPFPAKMLSTAVRVFVLSLFSRTTVNALLVMNDEPDLLSKLFFRLSGARIIVLSEESERSFRSFLGSRRVLRLKTGVDTVRFTPADAAASAKLKAKYGLDPERKVVLHVGHLNRGRNIATLSEIDPEFQVLLVTSTLTLSDQDKYLKKELLKRENIKIIDEYIPDIQEIYQLADVYYFPVVNKGHCIDMPLSCLEAAACNTPVVTTDYGAMKEFRGREGFTFIESFENVNELVRKAAEEKCACLRESAEEYDWNNSIGTLLDL